MPNRELAVPLPRMFDSTVKLLDLGVPTHEAGRAQGRQSLAVESARR